MEFTKFENVKEKERLRQQLREARDEMLDQAKSRREQRLQREAAQELSDQPEWMRTKVVTKIDKLVKKSGVSKRSKKSKKTSKRGKKHKNYSSSESDPDTSEVDSNSSSDGEPNTSTKKKKKRKKKEYSSSGSDSWDMPSDESSSEEEKGQTEKSTSSGHKKRVKHTSSSSSDSSDSSSSDDSSSEEDDCKKLKQQLKHKGSVSSGSTDADGTYKKKIKKTDVKYSSDSDELENWVEKPPATLTPVAPIQRDSWMTDSIMLKTFTRQRETSQVGKKPNYEAYDPSKSTRELNPYWKKTGTGLPSFQKPIGDDDENQDERLAKTFVSVANQAREISGTNSWRKQRGNLLPAKIKNAARMSIYSSDSSDEDCGKVQAEKSTSFSKLLTDQELNELGAKVVKAEILGNEKLASELKLKLETARKNRAMLKEQKLAKATISNNPNKRRGEEEYEEKHVLLTRTDVCGNTRPLKTVAHAMDERDLYGGRNAYKKQKRLETHAGGERMRYFPDDDKYDIKQMFEREKHSNARESNLEFAKIVGKHKNPNDDLDDIFADEVRKDVSQACTDRKEVQRAINEHEHLTAQLENCRYCFDSAKMEKNLLVTMGEQVYLALPWHVGLQLGHCIISTTRHISCCTQLDEDIWSEVNDFRKALTRMFAEQKKDVVFFEIANRLQRRPHLIVHCVPIPDKQAEMVPFYFKKAVEESELEWSVNKQLVTLGSSGKELRNSIPKGLPYFWVNFGMDTGFSHVIEDEDRFPPNFALEIIGNMMEMDPKIWRKPQKEPNSIAKVKMFADWWKNFDCTK